MTATARTATAREKKTATKQGGKGTATRRKDLFAPRPVRRDTIAGAVLQAMEVACVLEDDGPCDPFSLPPDGLLYESDLSPEQRLLLLVFGMAGVPATRPCQHCHAADHDISLAGWADYMREYDPEGVDGPPVDPEEGELLLTHEDRMVRYRLRAMWGYAIRHPDDVLQLEGAGSLGVAGRRDVRARDAGVVREGEERAAAGPSLWEECRAEMAGWERFRKRERKEDAA